MLSIIILQPSEHLEGNNSVFLIFESGLYYSPVLKSYKYLYIIFILTSHFNFTFFTLPITNLFIKLKAIQLYP